MSGLFLGGRIELLCGDCLELLRTISDNSIDSCVTDPPYHLTSIVKRFGRSNMESNGQEQPPNRGAQYKRLSKGFMGKQWDGGDIAFQVELWEQVLRVLKPGAHLIAFSGTRTYHRMVCAIEDAGFEIRDQIGWLFGSGFPKSHDAGDGWGTALKPAWEPIVLARKPLEGTVAQNVLKWGTGALNIDGCRIATDELTPRNNNNTETLLRKGFEGEAKAINPSPLGRWPANIIHDGSEGVVAGFPETGISSGGKGAASQKTALAGHIYGEYSGNTLGDNAGGLGDFGSAARFFYTAKADADDRLGSKHPTVKPLDLMQYLVRLVTPIGGKVLDPFAGTGTTGEAAWREGMQAILIEREEEYQKDIRRRMALAQSGPDERARESLKAAGKVDADPGPLFSGLK